MMAYLLLILYSVLLAYYMDHTFSEFDDFCKKHYHFHG